MKYTFLILLSLSLVSCWRNHPGPLARSTFVQVYASLLEQRVLRKEIKPDTLLSAVAESVLTAQGVTAAEFRKTVQAYNQAPEKWKEFFDEVTKFLDEKSRARIAPSTADSIKLRRE